MTQDIQSINELKSYTEYNVSTPTSVFTIGFQYEYNVDHVNVYVDGVEATAAGYTIQHDSHGTINLTPAVPSGVVRVYRETDIDSSAHTFSAGAKFTAGNMDENFQQIRHSQQEVRDGFNKLSTDTYAIIDTLQEVGQAAQDAADAAEQAAQTANDAAAQVNDKVSYQDLDTVVDNAITATSHNNIGGRDTSGAHPAGAISYGASSVGDFLDAQQDINDNQNLINNYIVYAEKYGSSLNEAMSAINTEFVGKRVRIYVPSDFPVTGTVNINIDCDLDWTSLQVQNDIDTIFNPIENWSGTASKCDIFVNNHSCRLGWNMKKPLGYITLDQISFYDVGNQANNTSAEFWTAFYLSTINIKKIDLYSPTVINSWVKPNAVVGDAAGVNRNILIEGVWNGTGFVSDINIYDHKTINLLPYEDSDALTINTSNSSIDGAVYNIDIYNGSAIEVGKRLYKLMLFKPSNGVRLHGTHVGIGAGDYAYSAIDCYGKGVIDANGTLIAKNFMITINATEGNTFNGAGFNIHAEVNDANIAGNNFRIIGMTGAANTTQMTLNSVVGSGGAEAFGLGGVGAKLHINKLEYKAWMRVASNAGDLRINENIITYEDAPVGAQGVTATSYFYQLGKTAVIKNIRFKATTAATSSYLLQALGSTAIEVENVVVENGISSSIIRAVTANNVKLRKMKAVGLNSPIVRLETNCSNVLLDRCTKTGSVLYYDVGNTSTNIVELNTLTF